MQIGDTARGEEDFFVVGLQFRVDVDIDEVAEDVADFSLDLEIADFGGWGEKHRVCRLLKREFLTLVLELDGHKLVLFIWEQIVMFVVDLY